jgi:hypothetical protein
MTWADWLFVAVVSPTYALMLCWLIMSDDHVGDIKYVFQRLTRGGE